MRLLAFLLLPALSFAQVPHTFQNGDVAGAEKINQNFNYVLENASGGCTVEQVDNTAEITCADGSTAVVPGYGTVVVYPEGTVGEIPPIDYNTGPVVVYDANDVALGVVYANRPDCFDLYLATAAENGFDRVGIVCNVEDSQSVRLTGQSYNVFFLETDCQGLPFTQSQVHLLEIETDVWMVPLPAPVQESLLLRSYRQAAHEYNPTTGSCINGDNVKVVFPMAIYTPAPEVSNAAYPVRLEQLP